MATIGNKLIIPLLGDSLPGREHPIGMPKHHFVNGNSLLPPYPDEFEEALFGLGCFWGAERHFWELQGVWVTAAGYAGGHTPNPTYEEVCSGLTGHNEVVKVVFDPRNISFEELLRNFWETHDPTQGMRQGNDIGTQYRSGIYTHTVAQAQKARETLETYQHALNNSGFGATITTEIIPTSEFYFAEDYHQQYLAKNPMGYCGIGGVGIQFSSGL